MDHYELPDKEKVSIDEQKYQLDQQPIVQRILYKLFPYHFPEERSEFIESGNGKGITTTVHIVLDLADRIRVLCGGIIKVEVSVNTEHEPGKTQSMAFTNIRPPGWDGILKDN